MFLLDMPTKDQIYFYLRYDRFTGKFYRIRSRRTDRIGKEAGSVNSSGYIQIRIQGKLYLAHRLAWILCHGDVPSGFVIDHIDGDTTNNRIQNLRLATQVNNCHNQKIRMNSSTGVKNVFIRSNGSYGVKVMVSGKTFYKSDINWSLEEAATYAANLRDELHGDFARHA